MKLILKTRYKFLRRMPGASFILPASSAHMLPKEQAVGKEPNMKKLIRKIRKQIRSERGYMTIEITILFPAIFFSLLLILFMGIILYQEVSLQSLAIQASERGSVVYGSRVSDMTSGVKTMKDFEIRDPYRSVPFMGGGDKKAYTSLVNSYVGERNGKNSLSDGSDKMGGSYTTVEDYLIAKRVKVELHTAYHTPADIITRTFGRENSFEVHTAAVSAVVDSPDFVRNVDLVTDILKQTEAFGAVQEGYQNIRNAIEKTADLLK